MKKIDFKQVSHRNYVRLAIWTLLLLLFAIWVESIWVFIIVFPFIFDGYVTKFIKWRWWESSTNPTVRYIMKWVEDIVVVLIIIHMLNIFIFQQFNIPSSSLEKTCLVGDYLYVSKLSYGPRIPMTPLAFPLVHNSFPGGGKAYLDHPQWKYKRVAGFGHVKRNDIVVFNFPTGDTVPLKVNNPDYYTLINQYGRQRVHNDVATFGKIVYRPVDMREHYVKRCIGMPGDSLMIKENDVFINGEKLAEPEHMQLNYFVQTNGNYLSHEELDHLGISQDDRVVLEGKNNSFFPLYQSMALEELSTGNYGVVYHLPLTKAMKEQLEKNSDVKAIVVEPTPGADAFPTYPLNSDTGWTRDNYGPIYIPKKGATIHLTLENLPIYERCIRNYEGHDLAIKDGRIFVDGVASDTYTFEMDYYFMMGDNRHNSADSRAWGFVPEDHIVGKPLFVWLSLNKDKSLFNGKIRWNRFFKVPR